MLKSKDVLELDSLLILIKELSIRRNEENGERKKKMEDMCPWYNMSLIMKHYRRRYNM